MVNSFMRGFAFARQERDRRAAAKQLEQQRALELERSQFNLANDRADRERSDAAFEANRARFGDVAGNPTATGQLQGIEQRAKLAPFELRALQDGEDEEQRKRLQSAQINALNVTKRAMAGGMSAKDALGSLPPRFREAVGLDVESVLELGETLDAEPAMLDAMLAGLQGQKGQKTVRRTIEGTNSKGERIAVNVFDDGTTASVEDFVPDNAFSNKVVGGRVISGNADAADIRDLTGEIAETEGAKSEARAVGKAAGETRAEDIVFSQRASNRAADRIRLAGERTTRVTSLIDEIDGQVDWGSAGTVERLRVVGGTEPANLAANLRTIQANSAFNRLQEMRDSSPTGGALGQVSERELELLRDAESALSQDQSPEQLRRNLQRYKAQLNKVQNLMQRAYARDVEAGLIRPESKAPSDADGEDELSDDALINKYL